MTVESRYLKRQFHAKLDVRPILLYGAISITIVILFVKDNFIQLVEKETGVRWIGAVSCAIDW